MDKNSVFVAAFWAGLASPSQLYSAPVRYEPFINFLTPADSFVLVGFFLEDAFAATENDGQLTISARDPSEYAEYSIPDGDA